MLTQEWNIQSRAHQCAVTGAPFVKGQRLYSALYWRKGQYERVDLCQEAWAARNDNIEPLSAWQTEYAPPPPAAPEALKKDDAESLLRRLIAANAPATRNARYILALMLERKKMLRQIERKRQDGASIIVYEHPASGEVWLIEDPELKLGELQAVQEEVSQLLSQDGAPVVAAPPVESAPESAPAEPAPEEISESPEPAEPAPEKSES